MSNDINKLRRLMRTANFINTNRSTHSDMAFALKQAWWFESFRDALANGFARFTYYKKDGTTRTALGTRSPLLIPAEHHPSSGAPNRNSEFATIPYFDLEKQEWRSFNVLYFNRLDQFWKFNDPGTSSQRNGQVKNCLGWQFECQSKLTHRTRLRREGLIVNRK